ncbi:leucine-rich repeat and immunoglobulin-like domain-containing nogo receptor-interacting protein 3 [Branchiostoma floridae]|uniref:Leucine-rich repeat and immunoglobulin-like domain-containing nogo receptor-interacting protein 3 n=1 Tax=Branchiostoma floridae TaxID=7739 RepID=A0A9J7LZ01_BRAFL|nr:leucine-rich repeat and immunoglobulin-like domain-containing nogo receptor-interacting protein 3 [Branchiostoma floridae]
MEDMAGRRVLMCVCFLAMVAGALSCPELCFCLPGDKTVLCDSKGLTSLPNGIPESVTLLRVTNNNLTVLDPDVVRRLPNLLAFYVDDNQIRQLPNLLPGAANLNTLSIRGNYISSIPPAFLNESITLNRLYLSGNQLSRVPIDALRAVRETLTILDLSDNPVVVKPGDFSILINLKFLKLAGVSQTFLPEGTLNGLEALTYLDISMPNLRSIPKTELAGLRVLQELVAERTSISALSDGSFPRLPTVRRLKMDNSVKLRALNDRALSGLVNVETVTFRNSPLLSFIEEGAFSGLAAVRELDLRSCGLMALQDRTFLPVARTLEVLYLGRNPFSCDCRMKWFGRWLQQAVATYALDSEEIVCERASYPEALNSTVLNIPISNFSCVVPTVVDLTPTTTVLTGDSMELVCRADGLPDPVLVWNTPQGSFNATSFNLTATGVAATLYLGDISPDNDGNYTCIARSDQGKSQNSMTLTVLPQQIVGGAPSNSIVAVATLYCAVILAILVM